MASAIIHKSEDGLTFSVTNGPQVFHLRAKNERQRQNWITALNASKMLTNRLQESEDEYYQKHIINSKKNDIPFEFIGPLNTKLVELSNFNALIIKHGSALQKQLITLESTKNPGDAIELFKSINQQATVFRVTTIPMLKHCEEFVNLATVSTKKLEKLLNHEREARFRLEEMCSQLAKQYSQLEERIKKEYSQASSSYTGNNSKRLDSTDEDEFFEDAVTDFEVPVPGKAFRANSVDPNNVECQSSNKYSVSNDDDLSSGGDGSSLSEEEDVTAEVKFSDTSESIKVQDIQSDEMNDDDTSDLDQLKDDGPPAMDCKRRTTIPDKLNQGPNLWSFLKNCVGKELTKIPMPVNFNEPLSMLQRMTEDFEYAHLLHKAAKIENSCDQLVLIAGFAVSSYSTTAKRTGKPFNPLLGETYECDRTLDLGWKALSEQVRFMFILFISMVKNVFQIVIRVYSYQLFISN